MTPEDRQEALSLAHVVAVAAAVGMTHSTPSKDYGIDITLHQVQRRRRRYFETGLHLDLQVKSTTTAALKPTHVRYDLAVKAYDELRARTDQPRVLVVLVLPKDEARWVTHTEDGLRLGGCLYWASLRGRPPVRNRSQVRITIPRAQQFAPATLAEIMERNRVGEGA